MLKRLNGGGVMSKVSFKDQVLAKFAAMPRATANEVAVKGLMLSGAQVASASKRAHDLSRREDGRLIEAGKRECSETGKDAMTFRISQAGLDYLKAKHIPFRLAGVATAPKVAEIKQPPSKLTGRAALQAARAQLS